MAAMWLIAVVDFAFIVVDDKGNDFFAGLLGAPEAKPPGPGRGSLAIVS